MLKDLYDFSLFLHYRPYRFQYTICIAFFNVVYYKTLNTRLDL
jgi:hypothetical protein